VPSRSANEKVGAETAGGDLGAQIEIGCRDNTRQSAGASRRPTRPISIFCSTRSSAACERGESSLTSSKKIVPRLACSNLPILAPPPRVKAPSSSAGAKERLRPGHKRGHNRQSQTRASGRSRLIGADPASGYRDRAAGEVPHGCRIG
jgi:hypothetical protein